MVSQNDPHPYTRASPRCWQAQTTFVLAGRATCVPHQAVNRGAERTTTVTAIPLMSWPSHALPAGTHPANVPDKYEFRALHTLRRPTTERNVERAREAHRRLSLGDRL
jgi:hypothetical protein